jgi:hypothetical protein
VRTTVIIFIIDAFIKEFALLSTQVQKMKAWKSFFMIEEQMMSFSVEDKSFYHLLKKPPIDSAVLRMRFYEFSIALLQCRSPLI